MRRKFQTLTLLVASLLVSCGGGGGGGGGSSTSTTIYGRVIDDPLPNAKVCLDTNQNYACDEGEPSTYTDTNGYFTLPVNKKEGFIIAQGELNGKALELFSANVNEYKDKVVVSPLTTIYKLYEDLVKDKEKAKEAVKYLMEKKYKRKLDNPDRIFEDYIENNDEDLKNIAQAIGKDISKVVNQGIHKELKSPYTFLAAIEGKLDLELIDKIKQKGITQFPIISAKNTMVGKKMYFINVYKNSNQNEVIEINGLWLKQGDSQEYWCYSRYGDNSQTNECENNTFSPVKYLEWKDLGSGQIEVQHADLERLIFRKFVELDLSNTTFKGCELLRVGCNTCIGNADIRFPQGSKVYALFSVRLEGLKKEEAINRKGWYEDGYKSDLISISNPTINDLLNHLTFENSTSKPGFYYDKNRDKFLLWNECSNNYNQEVGYETGYDNYGNPYVIIYGDFGLYQAICREGYTPTDILIRMNRYIVCKMLPDEENQGFYRVICTRWTKEGFVLDAEGFLDPKEKFFGFNEQAKDAIIRAFKNNCMNQ